MLKLNASYSKKVPTEISYSSKSYMACIEVELPAGMTGPELQAKIADTFRLVRESVESEISGKTNKAPVAQQEGSQGRSEVSEGKASNKQIKFILDLGKAREKVLGDLNAEVAERFHVESIYDLSRKEASLYLDMLKAA